MKILNQVVHWKKFSASPKARIGSLAFIVKNRGTVQWNVPNASTSLRMTVLWRIHQMILQRKKLSETEELEIIHPYDGETLIVLKETTSRSSPTGRKWLQNNIFHSKGTINGQASTVVIDIGSSENIISQTLVDRLKLKARKHRWLMTGDEVRVRCMSSYFFHW